MALSVGVGFFLALAVSAILTPWVRDWAERRRILDTVECERKIHARPIPRLGGIAISTGFLLVVAVVCAIDTHGFFREWAGILVGGVLSAVLGLYDDLRGADARTKFVCQFAVAGLTYFLGVRIETLLLPFGAIELGALSFPFTVVWLVGVSNAVNLIDGLDGLAGGISLIALLAIAALAYWGGQSDLLLLSLSLAGAVIGFLAFNYHPATIFMGDCGSLFLGWVLAVLAVKSAAGSDRHSVSMIVPVLLLGVPIFDTLTSFARRAWRGGSPFKGDREHVHHRLFVRFGSQRTAVWTLYLVGALFGTAGVAAAASLPPQGWVALAVSVALTVAFLARATWRIATPVLIERAPSPALVPISVSGRRTPTPRGTDVESVARRSRQVRDQL